MTLWFLAQGVQVEKTRELPVMWSLALEYMIQESIWLELTLKKIDDTTPFSAKEQEQLEEYGAFGQIIDI